MKLAFDQRLETAWCEPQPGWGAQTSAAHSDLKTGSRCPFSSQEIYCESLDSPRMLLKIVGIHITPQEETQKATVKARCKGWELPFPVPGSCTLAPEL